MKLDLQINRVPLVLGEALPAAMLDEVSICRSGLLRRLLSREPIDQTVCCVENCEFTGFGDQLHIYPCTHGYLNRDRQWRTKVTFFLKKDRLHRILFQVVDGQTAAMNFLSRFESAVSDSHGQPIRQDRRSLCWQGDNARVQTYLHPNRINADFIIELNH